jgi:hypothetical protein
MFRNIPSIMTRAAVRTIKSFRTFSDPSLQGGDSQVINTAGIYTSEAEEDVVLERRKERRREAIPRVSQSLRLDEVCFDSMELEAEGTVGERNDFEAEQGAH